MQLFSADATMFSKKFLKKYFFGSESGFFFAPNAKSMVRLIRTIEYIRVSYCRTGYLDWVNYLVYRRHYNGLFAWSVLNIQLMFLI